MLSHWASVRLPWPRFRKPPCDPGQRVFPNPVLTLAFPSSPFHEVRNAAADSDHASDSRGLLRSSFSSKDPVLLAQSPGRVRNRQVPRAPSPASGVTSGGEAYTPPRWALPHRPRYYELMCQSRPLPPPRFVSLVRQVLAGCSQPLRGTAPSRRCLCESFPGCLDPYPSGPQGACTRFFPWSFGLPCVKTRSALTTLRTATSVRRLISGVQSFADVQASKFARPPGRSHRRGSDPSGRPGLLRSSNTRLVTSSCVEYASRPNRATDGVGTFTPPDSQPCRLLL